MLSALIDWSGRNRILVLIATLASGCASIRGANVGTLPFWDYDPNSAKRTPIGGQFAWGGSLLKSNGGVQRFA